MAVYDNSGRPVWLRIRGAVVRGNHFISNDVVVSEALVKSYLLEKEHAVYPRIILSNDVFKAVFYDDNVKHDDAGKMLVNEDGKETQYLMNPYERDMDGFAIINPIWYDFGLYVLLTGRPEYMLDWAKISPSEYLTLKRAPLEYLAKLKEIIKTGLLKYRSDVRILSKYRYLFRKYRDFIFQTSLLDEEKTQLLDGLVE